MPELVDPEPPPPPVREGLPPSYRMRADRHYVDLLASRTPPGRERTVPIGSLEAPGVDDIPALVPLIESVKQHGVLQPLLVQDRGDSMRVIAGHRRLAAAIAVGLREVPCILHDVNDDDAEHLRAASNVAATGQSSPGSVASAAPAPRPSALLAGDELARALATAGGLAELTSGSLADLTRGAVSMLLRAELWRAAHLLQAARIVHEDLPVVKGAVPVAALVERVVQGFAPERRMRHAELVVTLDVPPGHLVVADERHVATAVTGAVLAMFGLQDGLPSCRVTIAASVSAARLLTLTVGQDQVQPSDAWVDRAFDRDWRERPGGAPVMVALAAFQHTARVHGGDATVAATSRGARLSLTIPAGA